MSLGYHGRTIEQVQAIFKDLGLTSELGYKPGLDLLLELKSCQARKSQKPEPEPVQAQESVETNLTKSTC